MDLIEARKLAHEGWVRSETQTEGMWIQYLGQGYRTEDDPEVYHRYCVVGDLDAEDWEPKPKPKPKPFEAEVWVLENGGIAEVHPLQVHPDWERLGWRRIRVREVVE